MPITCNSTGTAQQGPRQHQPPRPAPPLPHTLTQCPPALGPGSPCPCARSCPSLPHQPLPLPALSPTEPLHYPFPIPPRLLLSLPSPSAQPWLCSPFCPFEGIPLPQVTMGSPTFPSSPALRGDTTADPRVPLNQATTQSPLPLLTRLPTPTERPVGARGGPGSRALPWPSAALGCPGGGRCLPHGRNSGHSDITTPRSRSSPGHSAQGRGRSPPAANGPRPHPEAER